MEQFHKKKLYSLIIAGVALIAMILPWFSFRFGGIIGGSANGFNDAGYLSMIGIIGIAVAVFMGADKKMDFDDNMKKLALGSFAAIALGALIIILRLMSNGGLSYVGIGAYLCLIAGAVGLGFLLGKVKLPDPKKPA